MSQPSTTLIQERANYFNPTEMFQRQSKPTVQEKRSLKSPRAYSGLSALDQALRPSFCPHIQTRSVAEMQTPITLQCDRGARENGLPGERQDSHFKQRAEPVSGNVLLETLGTGK